MKILGIDYGTKKIGIAVSDEEEKMAFPSRVIPHAKAISAIDDLCKAEHIKHIVMGESQDSHMMDNPIMKSARAFARELENLGYAIAFEPEFMTSMQASRIQGYNKKQDASAAAIILQSYLDKERV